MITSTGSNQVKKIVQLIKKSKARREAGEYVVEGIKMVLEAPKDRLVKVYMSESFSKSNDISIEETDVEIVADKVFAHMSDTQTPQGIMAVVKMNETSLNDMLNSPNPLILILENLQDPGNLGTIVRMAEGAGVTGVLMSEGTVDIYNPKTIRSTMGSIYRMPFTYEADFFGCIDELKSKGICVYAAHLNGKSDYTQKDYKKPSAFMIGNEGNGLTEKAAELADELVIIPMEGQVESLNAAIACTVLSYEAARQRR